MYFQQLLPDMMSSKIERSTLGYLGGVYKAYKISRPRPSFPWDGKNKTLSLADFSIWAFEWARRWGIWWRIMVLRTSATYLFDL